MNRVKTMNLKGKQYAQVKDRIAAFHERHQNGAIETNENFKEGFVIFKSKITPDVKNPDRFFTGHSFGRISDAKAFEKLESVSVGRGLANAGFLISGEIASAEEMDDFAKQNTIYPTDAAKKAYV